MCWQKNSVFFLYAVDISGCKKNVISKVFSWKSKKKYIYIYILALIKKVILQKKKKKLLPTILICGLIDDKFSSWYYQLILICETLHKIVQQIFGKYFENRQTVLKWDIKFFSTKRTVFFFGFCFFFFFFQVLKKINDQNESFCCKNLHVKCKKDYLCVCFFFSIIAYFFFFFFFY